jgi:hypothetical protein
MCAAEAVRTVILADYTGSNEVRNKVEVAVQAAESGASQQGSVHILNLKDLDDSYQNNGWSLILRATNLILIGSFDSQNRSSFNLRRLLSKSNIPFNREVFVAGIFITAPACCSCGCNENMMDNCRLWAARNGVKWVTEINFAPTSEGYHVDALRAISKNVGDML